jgi:hypothetical protein
MKGRDITALLLLAALWGGSFLLKRSHHAINDVGVRFDFARYCDCQWSVQNHEGR